MTMAQMPDMLPNEAYAYYMALLFARDRRAALRAVNAVSDRLTDTFIAMLKAIEESSGLVRPGPLERLQWYRTKSPDLWQEQLMRFPRDWQEDWEDYQALRQRALEGSFGIVEQMAEAMLQAQSDLTVTE